jgi:membrane protein DedA with SNARE-associated domain
MITYWIKEIAHFLGDLGYWGVFISSLGLFPKELVVAVVGAINPNSLLKISIIGGLGSSIGSALTYYIGYYFRNRDILKFLNQKGKFLHISEEKYSKGERFLKKGGAPFIFFSRFLPWVRVVTVLASGYLKYNFFVVIATVFTGACAYVYVFAYIGSQVGFNWEEIKKIIDIFNNSILALTVFGILLVVYLNRKKIFRKR